MGVIKPWTGHSPLGMSELHSHNPGGHSSLIPVTTSPENPARLQPTDLHITGLRGPLRLSREKYPQNDGVSIEIYGSFC